MRFPGWTHQKSCWHSPRPSYQRSVSFALEHSLYRSGPAYCNVLVPSFCKIGRPLRKDLAVKRAKADTKEPSRTGATRKNMATYRNGRLEAERTHSPQECSEVECVDCFEHVSDPDEEFCVHLGTATSQRNPSLHSKESNHLTRKLQTRPKGRIEPL